MTEETAYRYRAFISYSGKVEAPLAASLYPTTSITPHTSTQQYASSHHVNTHHHPNERHDKDDANSLNRSPGSRK